MTTKRCTGCGESKGLHEFYRKSRRRGGFQAWCKKCCHAYSTRPDVKEVRRGYRKKARYVSNALKLTLAKNYGITLEQHAAISAAQGGVCGICGKPCKTGKRLAVDHDHLAGKVRGLLCFKCNRALGGFDDSHVLLAKAAAYLTRPPAYEILAPLDVSTTGE